MCDEKPLPLAVVIPIRGALLLLLSMVAFTVAASEAPIAGEVRVLRTELIAVGDHYLKIEAFSGTSGEIRIENRTAYELLITSGFEDREEQLGPGAEAVWRCDKESRGALLSMDVPGTGTAPLQTLATCDQRMRVTKTRFPM